MTTQHIETLIIGAGQAGLATGYHLKQLGREFLILDANERVGDNWRCHWESLRLFTPAKYDGLPGLPFPGDPWSFPGKDEVADYLEDYAVDMDLPVRLQTRVDRLEARPEGGFTAHLDAESITCDNVVVATGTRGRTPHVPALARGLASSIRQLHSTEYQRSSQLGDGPALVVGASHSGCEIAYEIAEHRPVTLCGRDPGNEPFSPGSGWDRIFTPLMVLVANHVLTRRTPPGRKVMQYMRSSHHGAPAARIKRRHLAERGVRRLEQRVTGVSEDGKPVLADGTVLDATTVIWCTGFEHHFEWIDLPVFDGSGWPREYRGVVDEAPGLFFCGLVFQVRPGDLVARFGGDEFVIACGTASLDGALEVADRILRVLSEPVVLDGVEIRPLGSIGVVLRGQDHHTADDLIRDCDIAMYQAKARGKGRIMVLDEGARSAVYDTLTLVADLRQALEDGQITLSYQPIMRYGGDSPELASVEALARWHHPERGSVTADVFVRLAEEHGLVRELGQLVLETACAALAEWQRHLGERAPSRVNVNMSALQMSDYMLVQTVKGTLRRHGLRPQQLCIEITESALMNGHTAVTKAVISLAHNLGLGVVAEGVETPQQMQMLEDLDCSLLQGFGISVPLDHADFIAWCRDGYPLAHASAS